MRVAPPVSADMARGSNVPHPLLNVRRCLFEQFARVVVCLALGLGSVVGWAAGGRMEVELPRGQLAPALQAFSEQTGVEIIYQVEDLSGVRTLGVRGVMTTRTALVSLLTGTGFEAVEDAQSGAFVVRRIEPMAAREQPVRAARAVAEKTENSAGNGRFIPGTDIFELSPFEVRDAADSGYRASNTVSATRVAMPTDSLPISINSFTRDFIEDQHAYDLYDIVKWAPGVHQDNVSPQGWVRYNMRGFTRAAVQRNGFGAYRFIDTSNIERVEVVKGPASLLYGQINPGGVINYITKRPEAKAKVSLDVSGGSHHYSRAVLDLTGPLGGEWLGEQNVYGRLVMMAEELPRFRELSSGRKLLFAPGVTWRISDRASLTVDFEHFERLDDMPTSGVILRYEDRVASVPYGPLPRDFSYAGEGDYQDFISDALTAELNWQLSDQLGVQVTYLDSTWDMNWRASGQGGTGLLYQWVIDRYYPPEAGLTPADAMYRRNRWEHQWGGERSGQIDVVSDFEVGPFDVRLLVGAKRNFSTTYHAQQRNNAGFSGGEFYLRPWDLRNPATWDRSVPFGIEEMATVADNTDAGNSSSVHAVLSASLNGGATRVLGGISRHKVRNEPSLNRLTGEITERSERSANVPQIGVTHQLVEGVTAFASYSESFLANSSLLQVDNVPTTPAKASIGEGSEAGFKLDLWDGRFSGSLSVYRIHANPTDVVRVTTGIGPDGTTLFSDIQGGSQLSRGAEIDLLFSLRDDLQVIFTSSWCDAIFKEHPTDPAFNGTPLVATPDRTHNLWLKYAPAAGPFKNLILAGGINHVGSFSHVALNPLVRMPAYTTADLTLGYRFDIVGRPVRAELSVKNLTDKAYFASSSSWGFPRQWILSVNTSF